MRSLEPTLSIGLWAGLLPETHMVKRNVAKLEFKSTLDSTKAKTPAMISQLSDTRQKSSGLKVDVCFQRWDCLSRLPGSRKHKGPQGSLSEKEARRGTCLSLLTAAHSAKQQITVNSTPRSELPSVSICVEAVNFLYRGCIG